MRTPMQLERDVAKQCEQIKLHPGDDWEKRNTALMTLNEIFATQTGCENDTEYWSPALFRVMRLPIQSQIKDLRSQIVKEVGEMLSTMSRFAKDAISPFIRELLPTLLETLNSGNKVIVGHMDDAMHHILVHTRVKKGLQTFIKTVQNSRSVQLRETCSSYITIVLQSWGRNFLNPDVEALGNLIPKSLNDASQLVRAEMRMSYVQFEALWPERSQAILTSLDPRTRKNLEKSAGELREEAAHRAEAPPSPTKTKGLHHAASIATMGARTRPASPPRGKLHHAASVSEGNTTNPNRARSAPRPKAITTPKRKGLETSSQRSSNEEPDSSASSAIHVTDASLADVPELGTRVQVNLRDETFLGFVRFVGSTAFASGVWVGVELDVTEGKNDGSVGGVRYFQCEPGKGLFLRAHHLCAVDNQPSSADNSRSRPRSPRKKMSNGSFSNEPTSAVMEGPADWRGMGAELLVLHKRHIDSVLGQLREEMELLADFERMQDNLSQERVQTYHEAIQACVAHRDEMSKDLKLDIARTSQTHFVDFHTFSR